MSETDYREQARKFEEAGAALLRNSINAIRCNKALHLFERKREVSRMVSEDLLARGQFVYTREGELYFFDTGTKALEHLHDLSFRAKLYDRFGLNKTEDETRFVEAALEMLTRTRGELCAIHQLSHWDDREHILYVSANDGTMFQLDGRTIARIDNGQHGVLFGSDRRAESIAGQLPFDKRSDRNVVYHQLFDGLSLTGDAHRSQALLKTWFLALFFPELLPVRPIVVMVGEKGARKTSAGRRFGVFLYGRHFEVGNFRSDATGEQDFLAAVTAKKFLIFDNADARLPWLPDHLAKLSTGAEIERRKLYTTNELVSYRPNCFLMLTSRTTPWKRGRELHKTRLTITRYETGVLNIPQVVEMAVVQLSSSQISLAGIVAAGEPIEPIPQTERVEVPKSMLGRGDTFALRVKGGSMRDEGILSGDVVVVQKQSTARNGQTVIALVNGEATIKTYYRNAGVVELHPANDTLKPIVVKETDAFHIEGIVEGVIRHLGR